RVYIQNRAEQSRRGVHVVRAEGLPVTRPRSAPVMEDEIDVPYGAPGQVTIEEVTVDERHRESGQPFWIGADETAHFIAPPQKLLDEVATDESCTAGDES